MNATLVQACRMDHRTKSWDGKRCTYSNPGFDGACGSGSSDIFNAMNHVFDLSLRMGPKSSDSSGLLMSPEDVDHIYIGAVSR